MPVVAMAYSDDQQSDWSAITPSSTETIEDISYSYDDMKVTVGGVEPSKANEFTVTINRNNTVEDEIAQGQKEENTPIMELDGTLKLKFTKEQWTKAYENKEEEIIVELANPLGDRCKFTFANVQLLRATIEKSTDRFNYVSIPLSPYGTVTTKTFTYEIDSNSTW